ncbi:MAG TPA: DUF2892 domain-containing protein [Solirubrobacterales bacterium]|nr:DUF2892 domain-containing protein [Solirubrobacterales bacterium]
MTTATPSIHNDRLLRSAWKGWPLERVLFALAGTMVGLSALLSAVVSAYFLLLTGFVSLNLLLFATVGNCGASLVLRRLGVRSGCGR